LPGFWTSFWLQFVNVKIILYGITALSTFVLPHTTEFVWVLGVSLLLALIGTLGNLCWALAGHLLQPLFQRHGRILNLTLAGLLVYCASPPFACREDFSFSLQGVDQDRGYCHRSLI